MWIDHNDFLPLVKEVWAENIQGHPSYILFEKLKKLRGRLKTWNWDVFGDVSKKITMMQGQLTVLDERLQGGARRTRINSA